MNKAVGGKQAKERFKTRSARPPGEAALTGAQPLLKRGRYTAIKLAQVIAALLVIAAGSVSILGVVQHPYRFAALIWRREALDIVAAILLTFGLSSNLQAEESLKQIASASLNEFDVAGFCYGATYATDSHSANPAITPKVLHIPRSQFGLASPKPQKGVASEFLYVTSQHYVHVGPYGDPARCEFKRYLYRLTKENIFKEQEIDERKFNELVSVLSVSEEMYRQQSGSKASEKLFGEADASKIDSVGGCLFPIQWFSYRGQFYALLSLSHWGLVQYVRPHYERRPDGSSTCNAWGERHLTNSRVMSGWLSFLPLSGDLLFVQMREYQKGFLFNVGSDFQCVQGDDVFSHHMLLSKWLFDTEIRPSLQEVLQKAKPDGLGMLSFPDSVSVQGEFAALLSGFTIEKGCK